MKTKAYAIIKENSKLQPYEFERRDKLSNDVVIEILYTGVCHSDIHSVNNDWAKAVYPLIPGHEIIGKVIDKGSEVTKFKIGDIVGVGCLVDSCLECNPCKNHEEQYCENGFTGTTKSHGGYSTHIVVREEFVLKIPENLDIKKVAPILCAGITTWSPLKHWNVKKGDKVGIIGLGGLGHMAVKLANALGAEVTVFSRTTDKEQDARQLGATKFILSTDAEQMQTANNSFDLILDTVVTQHDVNPYTKTLKLDGTLVILGHVGELNPAVNTAPLVFGRKSVTGSLIGGIKETQELLDFCGKHNITADVELINIQDIYKAYERMHNSDIKYRFVIDIASLKQG